MRALQAEIGAAWRAEQHALRMEIERLRAAVRYAAEHLDDAAGHIGNDHNAFADVTAARAYLRAAIEERKNPG